MIAHDCHNEPLIHRRRYVVILNDNGRYCAEVAVYDVSGPRPVFIQSHNGKEVVTDIGHETFGKETAYPLVLHE